ncbi:hypothetical protein GPECTOR_519g500 [Gonium pectorale]|uniref:Uncharacterized protein n=1 Tax=Gonium pectorale TaxID=33097 RepID=A0A150FUU4_GONPE|nr:hypothetical protein GPECTOR_519g500 [Gonium pectorale]|eukprot:KXZ41366.1 hypothetical protein GPECTOR_519g500 [Gonium pectorale]
MYGRTASEAQVRVDLLAVCNGLQPSEVSCMAYYLPDPADLAAFTALQAAENEAVRLLWPKELRQLGIVGAGDSIVTLRQVGPASAMAAAAAPFMARVDAVVLQAVVDSGSSVVMDTLLMNLAQNEWDKAAMDELRAAAGAQAAPGSGAGLMAR